MCAHACVHAYAHVGHVSAHFPQGPEEDLASPGIDGIDDYKPPCEYRQWNPGPLQEPATTALNHCIIPPVPIGLI